MKKIIAIDFDGVLFTEAYPAVGMPIAPNINRAKNERANGAVLILWTCPGGQGAGGRCGGLQGRGAGI